MIAAFASTEILFVYVHVKGEAHAYSMGEIPVIIGLLLFGPDELLVARIVGPLVILVLIRRLAGIKLVFAASQYLYEVTVAVAVFGLLDTTPDPVSWQTWGVASFALLISAGTSSLATSAVVTLVGAAPIRQQLVEAQAVFAVTSIVNIALGLVLVSALRYDPPAAVLLGLIVLVVYLGYRSYTRLRERQKTLESLNEFTASVGGGGGAAGAPETLLGHVRRMLRATTAELWLSPSHGAAARRYVLRDNEALTEGGEIALSRLDVLMPDREGTASRLLAAPIRSDVAREQLAELGLQDAVFVPVHVPGGEEGVLVAGNRLGDVSTFNEADVRLLEAMANHAAVALHNSRLVERLRQEAAKAEYDSLHDPLTGLPNRTLFYQRVDGVLREHRSCAVMLMDLDRFKEVNDTLGHHTGDELLGLVAARLQSLVREGAIVARLGGDEFAVMLPDIDDALAAEATAARLQSSLKRPFTLGELTLDIGASLGIALAPDHGSDAATLLQRADVAMYEAKAAHLGQETYRPERDRHSADQLAMVGDLRRAIETGGLEVHYQPIARFGLDEVVGVEALVRWDHPEHGRIPPDVFIPIAEQTGLIRPLTHVVLNRALSQIAAWRDRGADLRVSVNLSMRLLLDTALPDDVAAILAAEGLPASSLVLEVTESAIMADPTRSLSVLERLARTGISLAIDDFGTGYSSLAYLKDLPVDEVKIDKSFVAAMSRESSSEMIIRTVLDLARNLRLRVVAEGVEDGWVWDRLRDLGCDYGQGFWLGKPMSAADFVVWLDARTERRSIAG